MKKNILTLLLLFCTVTYSISQTYNFTLSQGTYNNLIDPNPILQNAGWKYLENNVPKITPIGFDFNFFGRINNQIIVKNNGTAAIKRLDMPQFNDNIFISFAKLKSRTQTAPWLSKVVYLTEGTAPNRIFKLEYNNVGFEDGDSSHFTNFQLWLYETSNIIEMHYGPNKFDSTCWWYKKGAYVGLDTMNSYKLFLLAGNPSNPTLLVADTQLIGGPANGMIYRFSPITTGIHRVINQSLKFYPNPTESNIEITNDKTIRSIEMVDMSGKTIIHINPNSVSFSLNTEDLKPGMYFTRVQTDEGISVIKTVKQ
jgi:hypothetical protein